MSIKNTLILSIYAASTLLSCSLNGAATSSNEPAKQAILCSIKALKDAKLYPLPMHARPFLENLQQFMLLQDQFIALNKLFTEIDDRIDQTQLNITTVLKDLLFGGGSTDRFGIISGEVRPQTIEGIAFVLRNKKFISNIPEEYNETFVREAQELISRWQDAQSDEVKKMVSVIALRREAFINIHTKDIQVSKPLGESLREIYRMANPKNASYPVFMHPEGPLQFLRESVAHLELYNKTLNQKIANHSFSDTYQEEDIVFRASRVVTCDAYDRAKKDLEELQDAIKKEIVRLSPKIAPLAIPHIPKYVPKRKQKPINKIPAPKPQQVASTALIVTPDIMPQAPENCEPSSSNSISLPTQASCSTEAKRTSPTGERKATITETRDRVVILDENNTCTITLFKVEGPQQTYTHPEYTPWVNAWFNNPAQALIDQGYTDPQSPKYKYRHSAPIVHGFSPEVDRFLNQCSTQSTIANRANPAQQDILITIPGCIKYPNGKERLGLFIYIIDSANGQWYHRNFIQRTPNQLVENYLQKGYYDVEFPELH